MVPESGAEVARELLNVAGLAPTGSDARAALGTEPARCCSR